MSVGYRRGREPHSRGTRKSRRTENPRGRGATPHCARSSALEGAGAEVVVARNAAEALGRMGQFDFTAGVIDWRPASEDHRVVARAFKQKNVRFLFYTTNPPEDVTTVRGAAPTGDREGIGVADGRLEQPEKIGRCLVLGTLRFSWLCLRIECASCGALAPLS
jgi:hypothetical protein